MIWQHFVIFKYKSQHYHSKEKYGNVAEFNKTYQLLSVWNLKTAKRKKKKWTSTSISLFCSIYILFNEEANCPVSTIKSKPQTLTAQIWVSDSLATTNFQNCILKIFLFLYNDCFHLYVFLV